MRDASKSGTAAGIVVTQRLIGERIEPTRPGVLTKLLVPCLPVMFEEPGAELLRLFWREGFDLLLKSLELRHDQQTTARTDRGTQDSFYL